MKIIKEGKSKEELEVILKNERQFKYGTCECIFKADKTEYESEDDYIYIRRTTANALIAVRLHTRIKGGDTNERC